MTSKGVFNSLFILAGRPASGPFRISFNDGYRLRTFLSNPSLYTTPTTLTSLSSARDFSTSGENSLVKMMPFELESLI